MLNHEMIKMFKCPTPLESADISGSKAAYFHRYSVIRKEEVIVLMAEYYEGKEWWTIGFITPPDLEIDLPEWEPKK
jgi:hypothetical protein